MSSTYVIGDVHYDLEFKRDMLPDSVEVKEYTMDNPEGVIL